MKYEAQVSLDQTLRSCWRISREPGRDDKFRACPSMERTKQIRGTGDAKSLTARFYDRELFSSGAASAVCSGTSP